MERDYKDIILSRNYALEEHSVLTKDGYILSLVRIPGKLSDLHKPAGPPVLIVHGILDSSDSWTVHDE